MNGEKRLSLAKAWSISFPTILEFLVTRSKVTNNLSMNRCFVAFLEQVVVVLLCSGTKSSFWKPDAHQHRAPLLYPHGKARVVRTFFAHCCMLLSEMQLDLQHFIVQLMHTVLRNVELLKHF